MRLFPRTSDVTAVRDPQYGVFTPGEDGAFDLPAPLGARLHKTHPGGQKAWETDVERQRRLAAEEMARRQDPATLLAAVEQLVRHASASGPAPEPQPQPRSRTRRAGADKAAPAGDGD